MSDRLLLSPQDPGAARWPVVARWTEWSDYSRSSGSPSFTLASPATLAIIAAAVGGFLVLGFLIFPDRAMMVALVCAAAAVMPWAVYRTTRHVNELLIVLVLIEAATASSVVVGAGGSVGAFIRYPLCLLFVLPVSFSVWRFGILQQGGFRNYSLYLLWAAATAIYSLVPVISLGRALATLLPFVAVCAIAEKIKTGEEARRAMGVLLAGCGLVVAVNVIALILVPGNVAWQPDPETGMLRYTGIFTEPNELGGLMIATLAAACAYWPVARGWKKALSGGAIGGAILLAILADSRSPLAAMAACGLVYLIWQYRLRGAIAIAALMALFYAATFVMPIAHDYIGRGDVASFTGRQVAWDFALRSIRERPLLGYGFEVEGQILQSQYFSGWDAVWSEGYKTSLHNGFISRAIGLGIPGLIFWLLIMARPMVSPFLRNRDPWSLRSIALLSLLPIVALNFTESVADFRAFAGIALGLAWALLERERLFARRQIVERAQLTEKAKSPLVRALQLG
jgi:O-Antigen ligase